MDNFDLKYIFWMSKITNIKDKGFLRTFLLMFHKISLISLHLTFIKQLNWNNRYKYDFNEREKIPLSYV